MADTSFLGTLGRLAGSRQQENQFSRTFLACFEQSHFFRETALVLLHRVCHIAPRTLNPDDWSCAVEVPTPWPGGGRPDIRIRHRLGGDRHPTFYLESKLASVLTFEQLKRYRKHRVEYLVAATKNEPEVSKAKLVAGGIFVMRWQDFHRALLQRRAPTPSDRFVAASMAEYLEELGMAYRERITIADMQRCRRVLNVVAATKYKDVSPKNGFQVADACLGFLTDLRRRFVEMHPVLERRSRWGPGYFVWFDESNRRLHAFGWDLFAKGGWGKDRFGCRIWLPERERRAFSWSILHDGSKVTPRYEEWPLKTVAPRDVLDQEAFLNVLTKYAHRWGIV